MQPPISPDTLLNNRYRVIRVLGQGGFGRTYLANDAGRFEELCALKELIPTQDTDYVLDKSQELFQREASTLYQIDHSQVPKFRATFEEEGRLFLVQDYVEGKSFRELLDERKAQGQTLSEPEVRQLLQQILPVLEHIHNRGIIHRDLSPDNIMLRQSDGLPVLIDFGVVKEVATRIHANEGTKAATTVGKLGFAPSEQIQMGRAYPSSDLYALAVTAIVLLTGKEPRDLYDDVNLTWHWRRYASVSDKLANVLNKMLNYRPGDRYASAIEVRQALQGTTVATPTPPATPPESEVSRMATMAVGRPPESMGSTPAPSRRTAPEPVIPPVGRTDAPSQDPWVFWGLSIFFIIIGGLISWGIFTAINDSISEQPEVVPTVVDPVETPLPETEPQVITQRLELSAGDTFSERGTLEANTTLNYVLAGREGQELTATLDSEGVWMTILAPGGNLVAPAARRVQSWEGTLPATGDYIIQLTPIAELAEEDYPYRLRVSLEEAVEVTPSPTPSPTPTPEESPATPDYSTDTLRLSPNQDPRQVSGNTSPQEIQRYEVNVREGQRLTARVVEGNANLTLRFPNGDIVPNLAGTSSFEIDAPVEGQYQVDIIAPEPTEFTLELGVSEVEEPPASE